MVKFNKKNIFPLQNHFLQLLCLLLIFPHSLTWFSFILKFFHRVYFHFYMGVYRNKKEYMLYIFVQNMLLLVPKLVLINTPFNTRKIVSLPFSSV